MANNYSFLSDAVFQLQTIADLLHHFFYRIQSETGIFRRGRKTRAIFFQTVFKVRQINIHHAVEQYE